MSHVDAMRARRTHVVMPQSSGLQRVISRMNQTLASWTTAGCSTLRAQVPASRPPVSTHIAQVWESGRLRGGQCAGKWMRAHLGHQDPARIAQDCPGYASCGVLLHPSHVVPLAQAWGGALHCEIGCRHRQRPSVQGPDCLQAWIPRFVPFLMRPSGIGWWVCHQSRTWCCANCRGWCGLARDGG